MMKPENTPVIIGIGELCDRPQTLSKARDPLNLMKDVVHLADIESKEALSKIDRLSIVNPASWTYENLPAQLSETLNISPSYSELAPTGGETPVKLLHQAADAIFQGRSECALIVGAEAQYSVNQAGKAGATLPWPEKIQTPPDYLTVAQHLEPRALQLGLFFPSHVYPLYDMACGAKWGQTPQESLLESAELWAEYAKAAMQNPYSWNPKPWAAKDIITTTPKNRMIAWPYTKAQVANPIVNQAAALIVTSLSLAKTLGINERQMVFINDGAYADEPRNFMRRDRFDNNAAQNAVLETFKNTKVDALELYSCFPIVPKMAKRILDTPDIAPTVTGGLSFFGAPLNNYMTHAACAMVREIRKNKRCGLLYGQGEFVTKHHALLLSKNPTLSRSYTQANAQDTADKTRGSIPEFEPSATGKAALESYTISFARSGDAEHAIIVAITDAGRRTLAKVDGAQTDTLAPLMDMSANPVGQAGYLTASKDGIPAWDFT